MADEEKSTETVATTTTQPSGGGGKLATIASMVNMVATMGMIGVLVIAYQRDKAKPTVDDIVSGHLKPKEGDEKHGGHGAKEGKHGEKGSEGEDITDSGKIIPLDTFTVNLSTAVGTSPRYVRMNISMELEQGVPE